MFSNGKKQCQLTGLEVSNALQKPISWEVFLHSPFAKVANDAVITEVNQDPFHHSQFDHRFTSVTVLNVATFPFCLTAPFVTCNHL